MVNNRDRRDEQTANGGAAPPVSDTQHYIAYLEAKVENLERVVADRDRVIDQMAAETTRLLEVNQVAAGSVIWRLTTKLHELENRALPFGTRRRGVYNALWAGIKTILFEGWSSFSLKARHALKDGLQRSAVYASLLRAVSARKAKRYRRVRVEELSLPAVLSTPLVSIIIPVYNNLEYTLRCLKSIQDNPSKASAEVVVVDDCSEDATPLTLPKVAELRYVRNGQNVGFIGSCNRGAAEARGEYLVFLNNDVEVQPGWLDELLVPFAQVENAGLVGAKLVYPDGRLQEAGSIIWNDGSGTNFGRGDDPRKPEYNYLREVDYCSGACLLVKAALFRELNGFDELFAPAYYEDTDLAFKVRRKGLKVIYQPKAEIIHFEGVTCGTDLAAGVKSYQRINAQKFASRWAKELRTHHSPTDPVRVRDRNMVARCLIVDHWPTPDRDSGSMDLIHEIKLLQSFGYKIVLFPENTTAHFGRYTEALQSMGVECLYEPFVSNLTQYLRIEGKHFDVVLLRRAPCAISHFSDVRACCPNAKIIFDTVDLHFVREQRAARIKGSERDIQSAALLKRKELEIIRRADCTLVVSQAERALLQSECPGAAVRWFPFVREVSVSPKPFELRRNLAFIGGYLFEPNVDAITYFVQSLWPYIRDRLPDAELLIAGSNMPEEVRNLNGAGVKAVGYVEDLEQFLESCRLTVAPLRYGAGIKGKVASSLCHGVPVVASPIAVEGMGCEDRVHVLIAETVQEWADAIAEAYCNETLWQRLSANGLELMRKVYSPEAGKSRLAAILGELGCPLRSEQKEKQSPLSIEAPEGDVRTGEVFLGNGTGTDGVVLNGFRSNPSDVRAIAFYLPQYHPIPENDRWWGKGFTEWMHVARARPLFPEHHQPRLPGELGFYDLRLPEVREAQADLAREYGVYGFCYYYYWFGGKRLLERPLFEMVASGRPDFPFCICWANESWTRRWDGMEQDILIKQEYSVEHDRAFIQSLLPVLSDPRYIRIDGKPLLLVYRTDSMPDPARTADVWREECRRAGIGDVFLCRVESFALQDPRMIGFDAACQFPPLLIEAPEMSLKTVSNGSGADDFTGRIFDFRGLARQALLTANASYKRFLGVAPSWDNTPRRGRTAYMWLNSSPDEYQRWLAQAVKATISRFRGDERLVFINAWNEWGEGCHLEPDQHYGRAFLQATRQALNDNRVELSRVSTNGPM